MKHSVQITETNAKLAKLEYRWGRPAFTPDNGIGPLESLYQVSDALVAVAGFFDNGLMIIGSGVMVAPGIVFTATHVLDEFPRPGTSPVFITFLPGNAARAWLPTATVTCSGKSKLFTLRNEEKFVSDLKVVSCSLNSEAHEPHPLSLFPMELCLPTPSARLWAVGFRQGEIDGSEAPLTPLVTSGLVTNCYPNGRGERMPSPCVEVDMEAYGGMSGGPVLNEDGRVVGIISSSFDGGPSYVTLVWDSMRLSLEGLPKEVWGTQNAGLIEGIELGLVRIKGKFQVDGQRNTTLTLTDEEMQVIVKTAPETIIKNEKLF